MSTSTLGDSRTSYCDWLTVPTSKGETPSRKEHSLSLAGSAAVSETRVLRKRVSSRDGLLG